MRIITKITNFLQHLFFSEKPLPSPSNPHILSDFLLSPMSYAKNSGETPLNWPAIRPQYLAKIYFSFNGKQVAYIHDIKFLNDEPVATIGHFATEADCERRGIGRAVASAFFHELNTQYGIETLIFSERSTRYNDIYPAFFKRIGAQPIEVPNQNIPNWHWSYSKLVRDSEAR